MRTHMETVKRAILRLGVFYAERSGMQQDWSALAEAINARMEERGVTQRDLAEHSGVSLATLQRIRAAVPQRRSPVTLAAVSRALGWPDGYLRDVLRGSPGTTASEDSDLAQRVDKLVTRIDDLDSRLRRVEDDQTESTER